MTKKHNLKIKTMCGIICLLSDNENDSQFKSLYDKCLQNIKNRGPDSFSSTTTKCDGYRLKIASSVLWLQGESPTKQPISNETAIFAYNGDLFNTTSPEGDTKFFLQQIENSSNILETLSGFQGPYAFIYLNKASHKIYFSRDFYGRRSLLLGQHNGDLIITSVAIKNEYNFIELPPIGVFRFDLATGKLEVFPWKIKNLNFANKLADVARCFGGDVAVNTSLGISSDRVDTFRTPTADELRVFDVLEGLSCEEGLEELLRDDIWRLRVGELRRLLEVAVRKRITGQPNFCSNCIENYNGGCMQSEEAKPRHNSTEELTCNHCRVGVLFSGGLDCTILALIADNFVHPECPIDLMNVAFDRVKDYKTPDRETGLQSVEELRRLRPNRRWNFLEINVTEEELQKERSEAIGNLLFPLNTILDESLGCALWFAARGKSGEYISPCRLLLVGMGADELFGGYTRHRAALKHKSWQGLHSSLLEDWQNISHRNLARDDRVVSDHGRQLRTPYLDEDFVEYTQSLHSWERTFPSEELPQGLGEKILLRSLAYDLGLRSAAGFKKRALQFGSRIANNKEKAHEVSPRL